MPHRWRRAVLGFHEALANAAEIGLFLLLGLLVFPSELPSVAIPALLAAAVLTFIARPAAVWACTLGQGYRWRKRQPAPQPPHASRPSTIDVPPRA